jgi:hypothetical protein
MRQRIRETLAVREALISTNLGGADAYYVKMEPLWARLLQEMKYEMLAKTDANQARMDGNKRK